MKYYIFSVIISLICTVLVSTVQGDTEPALKNVFTGHYLIGAALNQDQISNKRPAENKLIAKHFNSITPEVVLKWEHVHPKPGKYNFKSADSFVSTGQKYNMFIVGHTLVWHNQTPDWVFTDEQGKFVDRNTLLQRMRDHIFTVVGRYKGRIHGWDVVNEAVEDDGTLRKSKWLQIIGNDYIAKAFEYAHQADPQAELYYNDYAMWKKDHREGVIRLVKDLQAKGIAINGIGVQGHWGLDYPSLEELETSFVTYGELGVKIMVTELDITVLPKIWGAQGADVRQNYKHQKDLDPYPDRLPEDMQQILATRYADIFRVFNHHADKITRVTFWGVHDGNSWRNNWPIRGRTDYPLLFNRNCEPKAAFKAVIESVTNE